MAGAGVAVVVAAVVTAAVGVAGRAAVAAAAVVAEVSLSRSWHSALPILTWCAVIDTLPGNE